VSVLVCTIGNLFDAPMHDAQPAEEPVLERGLLTVPDEVWQLAVRRAEVIGPLAAAPSVGAGAVDAAATELGVSRRQVYLLLGRWRAGEGVVSDLIPGRSSGGRDPTGDRPARRHHQPHGCRCPRSCAQMSEVLCTRTSGSPQRRSWSIPPRSIADDRVEEDDRASEARASRETGVGRAAAGHDGQGGGSERDEDGQQQDYR
jgi:Helix-turn-helix domain